VKVAAHLVVLSNSEEKMSNRGSADLECCFLDLGFCRQYSIVGGVGRHQKITRELVTVACCQPVQLLIVQTYVGYRIEVCMG